MTRRYDDLTPEELPEVLREAVRRQEVDERERDARQDRESYAQAAEEMGISRAELDRAAAEAHATNVGEACRSPRSRRGDGSKERASGGVDGLFLCVAETIRRSASISYQKIRNHGT